LYVGIYRTQGSQGKVTQCPEEPWEKPTGPGVAVPTSHCQKLEQRKSYSWYPTSSASSPKAEQLLSRTRNGKPDSLKVWD